ncbi:MAG: ribonuclease D [Gammaproteobacteria bacterium]|nr:ribonuclease D [Gammaproteobacteria bacterium]MBV8403277.1 ribonuclease D [Gammaproteobacteria bacterium]
MQPLVATPPALAALSTRLAAHARIGLDTEFLRERTYRAQLCLLQVASADEALCIDPLALADLAPLAPLLTGSSVLKVMHASRQDLEVLLPVAGLARPVFDTQIAASLTGLPAQVGYAEAVRRFLGRELDKAHTRTDWSRRPLTPQQVEYALDDVRYLLPLAARLEEELGRLGRRGWLEEELAALSDPRTLTVAPEDAWQRVKGLRALDPARERLLRTLAAWRERAALEHNRPRGWILDDTVLRELVLQVPRTLAALTATPEMPPGLVKRRGAELLECIESAGVPSPPPLLPGRQRPDPQRAALVKQLSGISQAAARELNLVPEVLATRRDLEQLAEGRRDGAVLHGWRRKVLGDRLLAAL